MKSMEGGGGSPVEGRKREKLAALVITVVTAIISPCPVRTVKERERERGAGDDICAGSHATSPLPPSSPPSSRYIRAYNGEPPAV